MRSLENYRNSTAAAANEQLNRVYQKNLWPVNHQIENLNSSIWGATTLADDNRRSNFCMWYEHCRRISAKSASIQTPATILYLSCAAQHWSTSPTHEPHEIHEIQPPPSLASPRLKHSSWLGSLRPKVCGNCVLLAAKTTTTTRRRPQTLRE